jgi:hypothetical protein
MKTQKLLIVTDGLVPVEDAYALNPALHAWQAQCHRSSKSWFESQPKMPVEWFASLTGETVFSLITSLLKQEALENFQQLWIASPFHALLSRDQLRIMPDALFAWSSQDALWLCDLLNPLLQEEDMKLVYHQSSLFLLCREPLDAAPMSFANISGHTLPNRHPAGRDGGKLMRLMSEIQMLLKQRPAKHRAEAEEMDVDGLWLWGGSEVNKGTAASERIAVATRNPMLRSMVSAEDAEIVISEADRVAELFQAGLPLPKRVVLAGGKEAVLLRSSILPKFGKPNWKPNSVKSESALLAKIFTRLHKRLKIK